MTGAAESAVVLVDPAHGAVLPVAALPAIRSARAVYRTPGVDVPADPAPPAGELLAAAPVVLFAAALSDPAAVALFESGATVIAAVPGRVLPAAVAVMDRLRSPDGCPWDAEQTHESLRQYLVEECFELLEAIEEGDRPALREELGDVLLQVLFHARIAAEDQDDPFTIDDVAAELIAKLVSRHPHVFAGGDPAVRDAQTQQQRWEELKSTEKRRESSVDGVAMGQPALALAAKLAARTARAGLPGDLLPAHTDPGSRLFALAALIKLAGTDPEGELRAVARRFAADVRAAERAARAAGIPPGPMDHETWRRFWPAR
ncbi:MAG TPA: MazG family protein [Actinophytocola sp.]|uniref:MazG family protein n=1 Tax=Actinophytocola sp. TaxID=1872138 RepID=UPI002DBB1BE4|nr:MazG family protein [Actinophytocola sp.]HEU5469977.1 MazG family protein [Actinophytocola sp.]